MENELANWSAKNFQDKSIPPQFFARRTDIVARALLGKLLGVQTQTGLRVCQIVETEAYRGVLSEGGIDPASHSARGITPRSRPMFEEPGLAYVYFIYGMYEMLNVVTEPEGKAGAVLIRAAEAINFSASLSGPGKLCRALGITRDDNRKSFQGPRLFLFEHPLAKKFSIQKGPRVGLTQGKDLPWRFWISGHPCVSKGGRN